MRLAHAMPCRAVALFFLSVLVLVTLVLVFQHFNFFLAPKTIFDCFIYFAPFSLFLFRLVVLVLLFFSCARSRSSRSSWSCSFRFSCFSCNSCCPCPRSSFLALFSFFLVSFSLSTYFPRTLTLNLLFNIFIVNDTFIVISY